MSITVRRSELVRLFDRLQERLSDEIELETDYYLIIPGDEWERVEENPEPAIGSLHDDWKELQRVLHDDDHFFSTVDMDRFASLLPAISEKLAS